MRYLALFCLFLMVVVGCKGKGAMTEAEYTKAFQAECVKFGEYNKKLYASELPDGSKMTKDERRVKLAEHVEKDTANLEKLAEEFEALSPPENLKGIHAAYQELLSGQVKLNKAYSEAIRANKPEEAKKANEEFARFLGNQSTRVFEELGKAKGDVVPLRTEFQNALKQM